MPNVEIATPRGRVPAYVALPSAAPPWPAAVVIHDWGGMSSDLRAQADWLADEGFLAVAPDLYRWGSRLGCLWTIMRELGRRQGRTFDDIEAARAWAAAHDGCPKDAESWLAGACPMVGSFGGKDGSPLGRRAGLRLDRILTDLGVEHDVKIYPGVGHGFMNNPDPAEMTPLQKLLIRLSGTVYDEPATADARGRIASFFGAHLRG